MTHLGTLHATVLSLAGIPRSIVNLDGTGRYVHWHFIQISVANLIVIAGMVLVFALAVLIPFPRHRAKESSDHG